MTIEETKEIISEFELLDFVIQLEIAFNKKEKLTKGEVKDILSNFKDKYFNQGVEEGKKKVIWKKDIYKYIYGKACDDIIKEFKLWSNGDNEYDNFIKAVRKLQEGSKNE